MKPESTKKPYETPKLSVYGDIREITQHVDIETGRVDNAPDDDKTS